MDPLRNLSPFVYSMGKTVRNKMKNPHTFSMECCNVFIFVTQGNAIHEVDGRKRILQKGTLEIVPPFCRQSIIAAGEDTEIYYLYFDLFDRVNFRQVPRKPSVNDVTRGELYFADKPSYKNAGEAFDRVMGVILDLQKSFDQEDEWGFLERKRLMLELILLFFRAKEEGMEHTNDFAFGHVAKAIRFIEKNYGDPSLCAKSVSDYVGLNTEYLSKLFNRQIHSSLSDYIRSTRVSRSKELFFLSQKVQDVAFSCGFSSLPSFSRTFKICTGLSPREYLRSLPK